MILITKEDLHMSGKEKVRELISTLKVEGAIHYLLTTYLDNDFRKSLSEDHIMIDGYLCISAVYALAES